MQYTIKFLLITILLSCISSKTVFDIEENLVTFIKLTADGTNMISVASFDESAVIKSIKAHIIHSAVNDVKSYCIEFRTDTLPHSAPIAYFCDETGDYTQDFAAFFDKTIVYDSDETFLYWDVDHDVHPTEEEFIANMTRLKTILILKEPWSGNFGMLS
jgi:hypothetical protein